MKDYLRILRLKKMPQRGVRSCGGLLGRYGIYEQVQPEGTNQPCFVVMQKNKPEQYVKEYAHGNVVYKPYRNLPWLSFNPLNGPAPYKSEEQLWKDVRDCIIKHLDIQRGYEILASWAMATWTLEKWPFIPYLLFHGALECGKTRALEILESLSFRGWLNADTTPANLYRTLDSWHYTLFLDESEIYKDNRQIIALLNMSYRRGQLVPRQIETSEGWETQLFDCFSFKAIAGTERLKKTLESRCLVFKMTKNTRSIPVLIDREETWKLRNQLLTYRFRMMTDVDNVAGVGFRKGPSRICEGLAEQLKSSRLTELFYSLYETSPTKEMKTILLQQGMNIHKRRQDELSVSDEVVVLAAILRCYEEGEIERGIILITKIKDILNEDKDIKEYWWTNRRVSAIAQRIGFQKTRRKEGMAIRWDKSVIERLKQDLRYQSCFKQRDPSQKPTQSTQSTSTNDLPSLDDALARPKEKNQS